MEAAEGAKYMGLPNLTLNREATVRISLHGASQHNVAEEEEEGEMNHTPLVSQFPKSYNTYVIHRHVV
jgi:hypothetical protein